MKEVTQFNIMIPKALIQRLRAQRERMGLTWEEFLTMCLDIVAKPARRAS